MTSKNCRAEIKIDVRKGSAAESIYSAMLPDLRNLQGKDKLEMSLQDSTIHFCVRAEDLASLRANINSYLRLADAAYRCISNSTL